MNEPDLQRIFQDRLLAVEDRLAAASRRSGRSRQDVTLVAVTKTISAELAARLPGLGLTELGENRPQELWHKAAVVGQNVHWHLIGHLQRNKIECTLPLVHLIHAVDSTRLLSALDAEAVRQGRTIPVLLQVNTNGEVSKQGFDPGQVTALAPLILSLKQVRVRGLMTMAALQDAEACRPGFARLRDLRDRLQQEVGEAHSLHNLSMGMSNDFEVAVEEGATLVRLGTVLFEGMEHA